jgi:hypothetical protein
MPSDDKAAAPDSLLVPTQVEPPKVYFAACGALCDIFWWARRDAPVEERAPSPAPLAEKK